MDQAFDSRTVIKMLALDLLVRHGYGGMSFGDIANAAGITRANVHYHFGSKAGLVDEVLADYVAETLEQLERIWTKTDAPFAAKLSRTLDYSRTRYLIFNAADARPRPWSLISRLRQDGDILTGSGSSELRRFTSEIRRMFTRAAELALARREFGAQVGTLAIVTLLVAIVDNAAPITIAGQGFESLEQAYDALIALAGMARR